MTQNIGTFTAAGVDLDTAVASIKGIANLAAASGSSASQAASAMYQLSQAIAAGRISLMDWNSVVNAGMGGELFQNALKRTAKNFGTDVDAIIAKYGSFRESLTEGQWLTTEVLTETLKQISGAYTEADLVAQGYSQDQAAAIVKMAEDAKNAATNITTFSKLVDTLKESIGSGWAQTWQIVFGDFEEARAFWSNLYNGTISPMISSMSNARNTLLSSALGGGDNAWVKFNEQLQAAGVSLDTFQGQMDAVATENGKSLGDLIAKYGNLKTALASGEISAEMVSEALGRINDGALLAADGMDDLIGTMTQKSGRLVLLDGLTNILEALLRPLQAVGNAFGQVFGLSPNGLYNIIAAFNRFTEAIVINDDTLDKLTRTFKGVFSILKIFTTLMGGTFGIAVKAVTLLLENFDIGILDVTASIGDAMTALSDFILSGDILAKGFGMLMDAARSAAPAVTEFFDGLSQYPLIQGAIEALEDFKRQALDYVKSFRGLDVSQVFEKLATDATPYLEKFADGVGDMASDVLRYFDSMVPGVRSAIDKLLERFPGIGRILDTARRSFQQFTSAVGGYFKELLQLSPADALAKIIDDVKNAFANLSWDDIVDTLKNFIDNFDEFVDTITDGLKEIAPDILDGLIGGLGEGLKSVIDIMTEMGGRIIGAIKLVLGIHSPSTVMYEIGQNIVQGLMNGISSLIGGVAGLFSGLADAIGVELSDINWGAVAVVGLSAGTLGLLFKFADALNAFGAAAKGLTAPASGVGAVLTSISKAIDQFSGAATGGTRFVNVANGIKTIAEAIGIIAGAVAALTLVDTDKMWQAVGAVGAIAGGLTLMSGVMVGLSAVMGKFKLGSFKDIASIDGLVLSISGSFALLAVAMKIMGSLDDKALDKGIKVMERFQLLLANLVLIGGIFGKGVDFTSIGKMMTKLATTFLLASVAIRIIGGMEAGQIQQAVNALGMITLMLTAVVAVGGVVNSIGGSIDKIGSTMLKLSAAIGIMALVCRMLGGVDSGALTQGIIATGALSLFIVGLIAATKIVAGKQIAQIGNTLLEISASIAILAGVAVALSGID
ncbi:tape measure protein, partial [uncultured Bifidobacterium sp.]|uniref:tape measure protein n=1 Tax=uncultured Bifidobacterium sp. TaxID=165187 RepID=UPI002597D269